jgi:hypothetical protein
MKTGNYLAAEPEGILKLFLFGIPINFLADAFDTDTSSVEFSLRQAIRKREIRSIATPVELFETAGELIRGGAR